MVNTGWADYVFKDGYRLASLPELADFIAQHGRLPEMPSEREVQQSGASLGEMQVKMLAKIEELTLHMIEADKKNRDLLDRIARLEAHEKF